MGRCDSDTGYEMGDRTYIVATEDTNDFAVAVQLAEDPLLHVLRSANWLADIVRETRRLGFQRLTFFNSGCA
jgi:hypothetical protein